MKEINNISEMQPRDYDRMKETQWAGILKSKNPECKDVISDTEKEISNIK